MKFNNSKLVLEIKPLALLFIIIGFVLLFASASFGYFASLSKNKITNEKLKAFQTIITNYPIAYNFLTLEPDASFDYDIANDNGMLFFFNGDVSQKCIIVKCHFKGVFKKGIDQNNSFIEVNYYKNDSKSPHTLGLIKDDMHKEKFFTLENFNEFKDFYKEIKK